MLIAEKSANDSAQSPAWSRNARPGGDLRQRVAQLARLAREHQRRHARRSGRRRRRPPRGRARSGCWSAGRSRQEAGDQVVLGGCHRTISVPRPVGSPAHGTRLLGHPAHRHQAPRQLHRRHPPLRCRPGQGRVVLLRGRPALDLGALRAGRAAREHAEHRSHVAGRRARPRPVHAVHAEPGADAHPYGAWLLGSRCHVGRAAPDDAVQGEERGPGIRHGRPLHVPGAAGRGHPALQGRPRARRRRPAPASRARPRHRAAVQPPLRRAVPAARGRDRGRRRPRHGPPGADPEDVHDRRHAAGHRAADRSARGDGEEVPLGRDGLGARGAPRRGQGGDRQPDRDPRHRHRPHPRADRGRLRRRRVRPVQGRRRGRRRRVAAPGA